MIFFVVAVALLIIILIAKSQPVVKGKSPAFTQGLFPEKATVNLNFEGSDVDISQAVYVVLDVETTGLPAYREAIPENLSAWPFIVQISWALFDSYGKLIKLKTHIIKPRIPIPIAATNIHHITTEIANQKGIDPVKALSELVNDIINVKTVVAHNIDFDIPIIEAELLRNGFSKQFVGKDKICTMKSSVSYCSLPKEFGRGYKWPKLTELFGILFMNRQDVIFPGAHDAEVDTLMTAKCFFELKKRIDLKTIKGKPNIVSEIKPLIYDPDVDIIPKPQYEKIYARDCPDKILRQQYEYYRKSVIDVWGRLYDEDDTKIGTYGLDRVGYLARLDSKLEDFENTIAKIKALKD